MSRRRRRYYRKQSSPGNALAVLAALVVLAGLVVFKPSGATIVTVLAVLAAVLIIAVAVSVFRRKRRQSSLWLAAIAMSDLATIDDRAFEKLIGWLFEHWGYDVTVTGKTGDHGLDLVLKKDGATAVAQVKHYRADKKIGEPPIRDLYGSMLKVKADKGFFVTTAGYTAAARSWAKGLPLELIDGPGLVEALDEVDPSWFDIARSRVL
ncbi:MAG TPA: restriction endonuclease [Candidatus Paceibacterota bacterium]|nr:restriction endonuclease [Candidatus Paceibacterota bacterium]